MAIAIVETLRPCKYLESRGLENLTLYVTGLCPQVKYFFTDCSEAVPLLWIIFVNSVLFFVMLSCTSVY